MDRARGRRLDGRGLGLTSGSRIISRGRPPSRGRMPVVTVDALQDRQQLVTAARVVVKIGSSSLTTPDGRLAPERLNALVDVLAARRAAGGQVVLVSSGAIAAGIGPLGLAARPRDLATQQAAASVGQGLLVAHYTRRVRAARPAGRAGAADRRRHRAARALPQRAPGPDPAARPRRSCPVINENDAVATDEIRFGDNDRLAALVSHLVHADALMLLTDVDSLYTGPPSRDGSRRIASVVDAQDLEGIDVASRGSAVGTGGMVTKLESVAIATQSGVPVVLTSAAQAAAGARRRGRRHVVHRDRPPHVDPAALARARRAHARAARARRGRRARRRRARDLAAARRRHRARGDVRGGRPGRARRAGRRRWSARGLVAYDADEVPGAARPLHAGPARRARPGLRPRAGPPRRCGARRREDRVVVADHARRSARAGAPERAGRRARGAPGGRWPGGAVSSGAIAAGIGPLGLAARPRDLATQQAAASVGQGLLVAHYTGAFARHGLQVGQVLLTADDTVRRGTTATRTGP